MGTPDLLTIAQAAKLLGESRQSTARRVANEEISSTRLGDSDQGAHLLPRAEVLALATKRAEEKRARLAKMESEIESAGAAS